MFRLGVRADSMRRSWRPCGLMASPLPCRWPRCKHRAAFFRLGDAVQSSPASNDPPAARMLTPLQLQRYRDDGYLVLPGFKSAHAVRVLRERALAIVDA